MRKPLLALAGAAAVFAAVGAGAATLSGFSGDTIPMAASVTATCASGTPTAEIKAAANGSTTSLELDALTGCAGKAISVVVNGSALASPTTVGDLTATPDLTVDLGQTAATLSSVTVVIADSIG